MFVGLVCVVVSLLASSSATSQGQDLQCDSERPSPLKVTVNSRQNKTGHWISKVELLHRAGLYQKGSTVDVEHSTVPCAGIDESALNIALTFTASPQKETAVPKGYELFPGIGMYKFHSEVANWTSARQVCAEEGAHLVIFNSEKENDVIRTIVARYPTITGATHNDYVWVGIQQIGKEYFTVFGDSLASTGFERWDPSQPHGGKEDCILTHRVTGGLADITCDWKQAFICEHKLYNMDISK